MRTLNRQRLNKPFAGNDVEQKKRMRPIPEKDLTMMNCIERIVEVVSGEALSQSSLRRAQRYAQYVAERQEITPMQAVFMAFFVNEGEDGCMSISDLGKELMCRNIRILSHQADIDELVRRNIIRKNTNRHFLGRGYRVNEGVINALAADKPYIRPPRKAEDTYMLFSFVFKLTHARHEEEIGTDELIHELNDLYDENSDMPFVRELRSLKIGGNSVLVLSQMCRHLVTGNMRKVPLDHLAFLFDTDSERAKQMRSLQNGDHELMESGLVDFSTDGNFKDRGGFVLTEKARKTLLPDIRLDYYDEQQDRRTGIIKYRSVEAKNLVFNNTVSEQYDTLAEMLAEERYKDIRRRLEENKMRKGFTILFYGAPGTGKTEAVKQIAKRTGRDIMQVDISQMRSMWVGQSEKNIKAVFDSYREMCRRHGPTPILLFNEADAVFGMRREEAGRPVDRMENTMQNIILQEMEDFEGILIATTNLASNFDKAFERRFLYKIEFTKPDENARKVLWRTIMPNLDETSAGILARNYDFSGGQIENVARKAVVGSILYGGRKVDLKRIESYCRHETLGKADRGRIGFLS